MIEDGLDLLGILAVGTVKAADGDSEVDGVDLMYI